MNKQTPQIKLTHKDQQIFDFLLQLKQKAQLNTTFRVAGGWVRDKLLNIDSNDIDIALDDMTGEQLVHLAQQIEQNQSNQNEKIMSGFGVTRLNPDKSKHLETARLKILGEWIDIVNLRAEEYTQGSRVPTIQIGTPLQDALRRDLTINSMFYNINTNQIEDFTQKGIDDLLNKVIRTPLEPYQTFLDDPLRILRTFRFATRFQYSIEPSIFEALKKEELKEALKQKVSKERIGIEVKSVIVNQANQLDNNVLIQYLEYINSNNIWDTIFCLPDKVQIENQGIYKLDCQESYVLAHKIVKEYLQNYRRPELFGVVQSILTQEQIITTLMLSCICLPFQDYKVSKNKLYQQAGQGLTRESLKFDTSYANQVNLLINQTKCINQIVKTEYEDEQVIGFIKEAQKLWELAVFMSYWIDSQNDKEQQKIDEVYQKLYELIKQKNYQKVFLMKPHIDGNEVVKLFSLQKKGPIVKQIMDNLLMFQIKNQDVSKQQLIDIIQDNPDQFVKK